MDMAEYYTLQNENDAEKYIDFLKFLRENQKILKKAMGPYTDPDDKKNEKFYNQLCKFLKKQEEKFELDGSYKYKFVSGKGIEVQENGKILMYLVSDQFGFSAPRIELNHIYDDYLTSKEFEGDYENIKTWILNSRTLGGSFLWPKNKDGDFNSRRGGTNKYSRRYYIQDRVDLTLAEVKSFYGDKKDCPILNEVIEGCPEIEIWLSHFKNFKTFVEFFMFGGDFVRDGKVIKLKHMEEKTARDDNIYNLSQSEKKEMLDDLCNVRILHRTQKMEDVSLN